MFRRRRSRTGEVVPPRTDIPSDTARRSGQAPSRHTADPVRSREQGVAPLHTTSAWDSYVSMAPQDIDRAVTYRAGHRTPNGAGPSSHPYSADRAENRRTPEETVPVPLNYYSLLGIDHRATNEQVERAYRRLVARIHPDKVFADADRYAESLEQLREVNVMMLTLRDPVTRAEYDAMLTGNRLPPLTRRLADIHRRNRTVLERAE